MADKALALTGTALTADRHPALVYLAGLRQGSQPATRNSLNTVARLLGAPDLFGLDWREVRYQHVSFVRARLEERYAPKTANRHLSALRRVLRQCWLLGYLPEGEYRKLAEIENVTGKSDDIEDDLIGREVTPDELSRLMEVCQHDKSYAGARDAALIALAYGLGLRRQEIASARMGDYDAERGIFRVKYGKGGKSRTLPIDNGARLALDAWVAVRGNAPGKIFYGVGKSGYTFNSKAINARSVHEGYQRRVAEAGLAPTGLHDLRRSFVTHLLDNGVDVALVAKLAGHSDPRTTMRYDKRSMDKRRTAINMLAVPYK